LYDCAASPADLIWNAQLSPELYGYVFAFWREHRYDAALYTVADRTRDSDMEIGQGLTFFHGDTHRR